MYITENIKKEILIHKDYIYDTKYKKFTYVGILSGKQMHWLANKFYWIWKAEGDRCNNENNISYKWYGNNKIKRVWTSRECIDWGINELFTRDIWHKRFCISRKQDLGNYELGNIKLLEARENSIDVKKVPKNLLLGPIAVSKAVKLIKVNDKRIIKIFKSASAASRFCDKCVSSVRNTISSNGLISRNEEWWKPEYLKD